MSKEVVIAGVAVSVCIAVAVVAFVLPHHSKPKPIDSALVSTDLGSSNDGSNPITDNNNPGVTPPTVSSPDLGNNIPQGPGLPNGQTGAQVNGQIGGGSSLPPGPNQIGQIPVQPQHPWDVPKNQTPPPQVVKPPPQVLPEPPAPEASTEVRTHIVASGDTLGQISMQYYGTSKLWKKIAEANKVEAGELTVGQKLTIPVVEGTKPKDTSAQNGNPTGALSDGQTTYKIKPGDGYYKIAKTELGDANRWKEIEKLNNIDADDLVVGQTIKLPAKTSKEAAEIPSSPTDGTSGTTGTSGTSGGRVHVVVAGDTLGGISKQYLGTSSKWKDIVKANPGVDPEGLKVGQKLNIPESAGGGTSGSPTQPPAEVAFTGNEDTTEYVVKKGDSLASIARSQLGSKKAWKRIVEINPGIDEHHLRSGQKLKIPARSKSGETQLPTGAGGPPTLVPVPVGGQGSSQLPPPPPAPPTGQHDNSSAGTPIYPLPPVAPPGLGTGGIPLIPPAPNADNAPARTGQPQP